MRRGRDTEAAGRDAATRVHDFRRLGQGIAAPLTIGSALGGGRLSGQPGPRLNGHWASRRIPGCVVKQTTGLDADLMRTGYATLTGPWQMKVCPVEYIRRRLCHCTAERGRRELCAGSVL